jgi:hypothetical protein
MGMQCDEEEWPGQPKRVFIHPPPLRMRSVLKLASGAAIPIEVVNFWIVGYPADTHPFSAASHYAAIALQWYVIHLPAIFASDHSLLLRENATACSIVVFFAGYIDTVILLAIALWILRVALHALHKLSSPLRHAH